MTDRPPRIIDIVTDAVTQSDAVAEIVDRAKGYAADALVGVGFSRPVVDAMDLETLSEVVGVVSRLSAQQAPPALASLPLRPGDVDALEVALASSRAAPAMVARAADVLLVIRRLVPDENSISGRHTAVMMPPPDRLPPQP